jgi:hypothetical protein
MKLPTLNHPLHPARGANNPIHEQGHWVVILFEELAGDVEHVAESLPLHGHKLGAEVVAERHANFVGNLEGFLFKINLREQPVGVVLAVCGDEARQQPSEDLLGRNRRAGTSPQEFPPIARLLRAEGRAPGE